MAEVEKGCIPKSWHGTIVGSIQVYKGPKLENILLSRCLERAKVPSSAVIKLLSYSLLRSLKFCQYYRCPASC